MCARPLWRVSCSAAGWSGIRIDTWTALGASAAGLIILSGDLAVGVGFQLSVVATAGVLAGAGALRGRRPAWAWAALSVTIAAQAAVTPLLLWHFGTVPLFSPLANLAALPFVTLATVAGGVGVLSGWSPLVAAGSAFAAGVLWIARIAAGWPQLGPAGLTLVIAIALLAMAKAMRKVVAVAVAAAALRFLAPPGLPEGPTATFLDVGQGDAVVLRDDLGSVILIDGGRDPVVLTAGLRRTSVGRIDVLVVTHGDADHAGGLDGIFEHIDVRHLWVPDQPGLGLILSSVIEQAAAHGVPVEHLRSGVSVSIGRFAVEVIGPRRRYLSSNNGSVVLWVRAGPRSLLLAGDVEAVAQRELPVLHPDILLVPHHGSATNDLGWLRRTAGDLSVVSVGDNTYGHPAPAVLDALVRARSEVYLTSDLGDIVVPLQ